VRVGAFGHVAGVDVGVSLQRHHLPRLFLRTTRSDGAFTLVEGALRIGTERSVLAKRSADIRYRLAVGAGIETIAKNSFEPVRGGALLLGLSVPLFMPYAGEQHRTYTLGRIPSAQ
jgi:hypothetical protein